MLVNNTETGQFLTIPDNITENMDLYVQAYLPILYSVPAYSLVSNFDKVDEANRMLYPFQSIDAMVLTTKSLLQYPFKSGTPEEFVQYFMFKDYFPLDRCRLNGIDLYCPSLKYNYVKRNLAKWVLDDKKIMFNELTRCWVEYNETTDEGKIYSFIKSKDLLTQEMNEIPIEGKKHLALYSENDQDVRSEYLEGECVLWHENGKHCPCTESDGRHFTGDTDGLKDTVFFRRQITNLLRYTSALGEKLGIHFIVHGGVLIGQHFNGYSLPFDDDVDMHIYDSDATILLSYLESLPDFTQLRGGENKNDWGSGHHKFFLDHGFIWFLERGSNHHIELNILTSNDGKGFKDLPEKGVNIHSYVYVDLVILYKVPAFAIENVWGHVNEPASHIKFPTDKPWENVLTTKSLLHASGVLGNQLILGHAFFAKDYFPLKVCKLNNIETWCSNDTVGFLDRAYSRWRSNTFKDFIYDESTQCWLDK